MKKTEADDQTLSCHPWTDTDIEHYHQHQRQGQRYHALIETINNIKESCIIISTMNADRGIIYYHQHHG